MAEGFRFGDSSRRSGLRRRALAELFLREGTSGAPVQHWLQGLNRVAQGLVGGLLQREARDRALALDQAARDLGGNREAAAPMAPRPDVAARPAASVSGPGPGTPGTAADVAFFNGRGWAPVQSAALASTIANESRGDTAARNPRDGRDGSDSIGAMQWNGSRAVALQRFAAARGRDWRDRQTQLEFVDAELRGQVAGSDESRWGNLLARAGDPHAATRAATSYVRPRGWTAANPDGGHNFARRLAMTQAIHDRFGAAAVPGSTAVPAPAPEGGMAGDSAPPGLGAQRALPPGAPAASAHEPLPNVPSPRDLSVPGAGPRLDLSRALGIPDRDRLMLLRDEASLAPGEAGLLRARLSAPEPGAPGAPVPAGFGPFGNLPAMGRQARGILAGPALQAELPGPAGPLGADAGRMALIRAAISPAASPETRQLALTLLQQDTASGPPAAPFPSGAPQTGAVQAADLAAAGPVPAGDPSREAVPVDPYGLARDAIRQGADLEAVKQRLRENGYDPEKL